jgi:branched-chain amino acid transport system permease protein
MFAQVRSSLPRWDGDPGRAAPVLGWVLYALIVVWLLLAGSLFDLYIAGLVMIYAISALGLDWIQGRAGQVSIGSAAFMAIGAYTTATLSGIGAPTLVCLLLSALAGAAVGFIVGLPALRLRGLYLALSTLALQFITFSLALQYETSAGKSAGFFVPPASIGPLELTQGRPWTIALALALTVIIIGLLNLYGRAPGRAWLAIKESEIAAAVIGLNPTRWKLSAFVVSSALISLSGALLAYYTLRVFSDSFSLQFALTFVVMVIVGGLGSIPGVLLGALLITISPYVLSALTAQLPTTLPITEWLENNVYYINNGLYGVLVLLFLLYQPRGIAGALEDLGRLVLARHAPSALRAPPHPTPGVRARGSPPVDEPSGSPALAATAAAHTASSPPLAPLLPSAAAASANRILEVRDLRLVYRTGARALDGIDLDVGEAEIVALLGRNGAGKTSTLRALSGFFVADQVQLSGSIRFDGRDIRGDSPIATARRGLVLVPERDKVFPNLSVEEHLKLAGGSDASRKEVEELFPVLQTRRSSPAGLLSGGERQMLALAVAWRMQPRLLLVDELSLGLAPAIVKRLMARVKEFRDRTRVPILLVEQNASAALEVADRVYVLEAGRITSASAGGALSRETVVSAVVGE